MNECKSLVLSLPVQWATELSRFFSSDSLDIISKGKTHIDQFIPEHRFYEPINGNIPPVTKEQWDEIVLSLRRCLVSNKKRKEEIAEYLLINAENFLKTNQYKNIIFRTGPHMPHELAIYHRAQKLGIPTLFFDETGYFDRAFIFSNIYKRKPTDGIKVSSSANFKFNAEQRKIVTVSDLRKNYAGLSNVGSGRYKNLKNIIRALLYVVKTSIKRDNVFGSAGFSRNIIANSMFDKMAFWSKVILRNYALRRTLRKLEEKTDMLDYGANNIVFLLNYQPERTTLPDAYPYYDSRMCVRELNNADWPILVKEHPVQLNYPGDGGLLRGATWRTIKFYDDIADSSLGFIPREVRIEDERLKDKLISTATGSVAVEMFFRKKPILVFANSWISGLPNVIRLAELNKTSSDITYSYDPFKELENVFANTVNVINWKALTDSDIDVIRFLMNGAD